MIRIDNTKTNATTTTFTVIDEASKSITGGDYASCVDAFDDATDITSHATTREQIETVNRLRNQGYNVYCGNNKIDVAEFRQRVEAAR